MMDGKQKKFIIWLLLIVVLTFQWSEACSCSKKHPQEHYCTADFVVLAHVKKAAYRDRAEWSHTYKVRVKKEFKVTAKAREALAEGRILTPSSDGMCGIRLKPGRKYVLSGSVQGGKPWINLCNWSQDWDKMTALQRKGFRKLYKQGCDCKVMDCHWWSKCPISSNTCAWNTALEVPDCQEMHAICMRNHQGSCQWTHSRSYRSCKTKKLDKTPAAVVKEASAVTVATAAISTKRNSYQANNVISV